MVGPKKRKKKPHYVNFLHANISILLSRQTFLLTTTSTTANCHLTYISASGFMVERDGKIDAMLFFGSLHLSFDLDWYGSFAMLLFYTYSICFVLCLNHSIDFFCCCVWTNAFINIAPERPLSYNLTTFFFSCNDLF